MEKMQKKVEHSVVGKKTLFLGIEVLSDTTTPTFHINVHKKKKDIHGLMSEINTKTVASLLELSIVIFLSITFKFNVFWYVTIQMRLLFLLCRLDEPSLEF